MTAPRPPRRPLARRPLGLLLALCLALGLGAALAQTDRAEPASFLERQLQNLVPGLQVEGLEGAWRAAPRAERITLSDSQGVWLVLRDVRLNIAPTSLLRGILRLEALEASVLRIDRLPVPDPNAPPPDPSAGLIPRLPSLPVDLALDRLAIARLELAPAVAGQAADFALDGRASLNDQGLTAALALRRLDREGSATVDLALAPASDRLRARVEVREPEGGLVAGLIGRPDSPLSLDLGLDGPAAAGAALTLRAALGPDTTLAASGTVRAPPEGGFGAMLEGEASAAPLLPSPALADLAFPARFAVDATLPAAGPLRLDRLALTIPAGEAGITGTLNLETEAADLTLRLSAAGSTRFTALLPPEPALAWQGIGAEAHLTGTLAAPRLAFRAQPEGLATGIPQADAVLGPTPTLAGTAALPGPTLDVTIEGAEGRLLLAGSAADPLDLTARLSLPRLEVLGAGSEGALEAVAQTRGSRADPTVTLTARSGRIVTAGRVLAGLSLDARVESPATAPRAEASLEARLDGLPVTLALRGQPEGDAPGGGPARVRLEQARAALGPAVLTASGALDLATTLFDGRVRLEAADLAPLARLAGVAGLEGRLSAEAALAPRDSQQGFDATVEAPRLVFGGTAARLRLAAEGTPQSLGWSVEGSAEPGRVAGRGRLSRLAGDAGWRAELAALQAEAFGETVRLAAPASVTIGADGGIALGNGGLALGLPRGGRLAASGRWGPERADVTATLTGLSAALAARFLPEMTPSGTLSGDVRLTGPVAQPEFRANLRGEALQAGAAWSQGLPPLGLRAEASGRLDGPARLRAVLEAGRIGQVTLVAALPRAGAGFGPAAPLEASLDGALALQPLTAPFLAAGADRVDGRVQLALRAGGTLGAPQLGGRATLAGGSYRNPVTGVRVTDLNGSITGQGTRLVVERLQGVTAGGGTIALSGGIDLGAPGFPADLRLVARQARPVVSDLGTATLDADLRLTGPVLAAGGRLGGEVRIQRAEIRIPNNLPSSIPVIEPVQVRGRKPPGAILPPSAQPGPAAGSAPSGLPPIALDIAIRSPGQIYIRGRGVNVELGGDVRVGGTLAQPMPSGGLTLRRGTLDVLARRLTFDRGRIDFAAGTLIPQLDLTARAQARNTSITIQIQGPPTAPEITFSSSPELPQDEILARLLFDRATSNLSPFEIAQIAEALAQLTGAGSGGAAVLDKVRSALGLDRLGVAGAPEGGESGSGRGSGPSVEAGRYVAPGVYVGLRQGVQGGQTGVGVEVELTPRLRLEGQTATGPAGDRIGLTYQFEY